MTNINQPRLTRYLCESRLIEFARYLFKNRDGRKLLMRPLHRLICSTLECVYNGEINRLIINVPPGYTKTELVVKAFGAWGMIRNPRSKFMHLSYSDQLASENSASIKETIEAEYIQSIWPMLLKHDAQAKKRWYTDQGGGFYAAATGAAVTGFRAGRDLASNEFSGALLIDDPLKPEDAYSRLKREAINNRFTNTVRSRLVNESVPIVIIMQRLHVDDLSGVLLKGASGDMWYHLLIPAEYDAQSEYPAEYTHGIPIPVTLDNGPIWAEKHTSDQLLSLAMADKYTFNAQYMQRPVVPGGSVIAVDRFGYYATYDRASANLRYQSGALVLMQSLHLFCDTAHKTGQHNDYSVFALWGKGSDGRIFLLDLVRDKLEAPALKRALIAMCSKWQFVSGANALGLREVHIEDKASGIGLIQEVAKELKGVRIIPVPRNTDKVSRAYSAAPAIDEGRVILPMGAPYLRAFVQEHEDFSPRPTKY